MTLGTTPAQADLFRSTTLFCAGRVREDSIYAVLHRECFRLFPDEMFADLFTDVGRRSVPPMIVATVMVLQRVEGLSDREAVDRFAFDARWKYAAGGLDFDYPGFVHTVLVDMRARLADSSRPDRVFEATLTAAKVAGLVGRKRVLDSTALYDAVATMDTVTLIRSAIRGLLRAADEGLEARLRAVLGRDDDYGCAGKPVCDYDDLAAREALVDALAKDAHASLLILEGGVWEPVVEQAGRLLATVVGQDLDHDVDGVFRIARRVARDRVISTVDPQARHGHKTAARGFDGYKGHVGIDPDSEIITGTTATAGNVGDADAAMTVLADDLPADNEPADNDVSAADGSAATTPADDDLDRRAGDGAGSAGDDPAGDQLQVYGDAAYGAGELQERLDNSGVANRCKVQPASPPQGGLFSKDEFDIDLDAGSVGCPAGQRVPIRPARSGDGGGTAEFGQLCRSCPLASRCTSAAGGRTVRVGRHERLLARERAAQSDPAWQADYRATRPKVERKIAHLMRRRHGGRRARVRGLDKVAADFSLLAAGINLARLGVLNISYQPGRGWATA
jgi:hypothetical protein